MSPLLFALVDAELYESWLESRWACGLPLDVEFAGCPGCDAHGRILGEWRSLWGVL